MTINLDGYIDVQPVISLNVTFILVCVWRVIVDIEVMKIKTIYLPLDININVIDVKQRYIYTCLYSNSYMGYIYSGSDVMQYYDERDED